MREQKSNFPKNKFMPLNSEGYITWNPKLIIISIKILNFHKWINLNILLRSFTTVNA